MAASGPRPRTTTPRKVVVINEALARKYFPAGDALGHSIRLPELTPQPPFVVTSPGADGWLQIVGITADKLNDGLDKPVLPELFVPFTLLEFMGTQVLIKTDGPPTALLHAIGLQVKSVDADQQVAAESKDLEHWISDQTEYQQGPVRLLALRRLRCSRPHPRRSRSLQRPSPTTVAQRTNEFGIRMALGALRSHVLGLVFRSTGASVGIGIVTGLALSLLLRKLFVHWTGVATNDLWALPAAIAVLAVVALVAGGIPARRAARIEPMEALRYE